MIVTDINPNLLDVLEVMLEDGPGLSVQHISGRMHAYDTVTRSRLAKLVDLGLVAPETSDRSGTRSYTALPDRVAGLANEAIRRWSVLAWYAETAQR